MDPRDYAVLSLDEKRLPGMPRQAFKRRSPVPPPDPRDRALAEQIVIGAVKNFLHLVWLASEFAGRPADQIDSRAKLILAVALYQLRFLERVPEHAIVKEGVAQTRRMGEPSLSRAAGFVNAVLREAIRRPDVSAKLPSRSDAASYAELVLSHPRPLFARLAELLGNEDALRFCEHDNRTPPTLVRLARGRGLEGLKFACPFATSTGPNSGLPTSDSRLPTPSPIEILPHEQPGIAVVRGAKQADFAAWADAGIAQVQDATSAAVVAQLDVCEGMTVLDRCCGLGTKTQQLAEAVGPDGSVFAVDALGARITTLRRLIARRSDLVNVKAKRAEWMSELPADWPSLYDRILIDAPCSNTGVLARRPEARYNELADAQRTLPPLQLAILRDTWRALAPQGLLAYATCSILPEENGGVVQAFLAEHPEAELVHEASTWPSFATDDPARYRDGGYVAILRHRG